MRIVISGIEGQAPMVFEDVGATMVLVIPRILPEPPDAVQYVPAYIQGSQPERDFLAISAVAAVLDATPFEMRVGRANFIRAKALEAMVTDKAAELAEPA